MALNTQLANATANAGVDAMAALMNGGTLNIYDGSQPANANTAISTQNLLVTLTFANPAWGSGSAGVATANAIVSGTVIFTGTAAWFRIKTSGAATVLDGSVGTSGCNINLGNTSLVIGGNVAISAGTFTEVEAGS